MLRLPDRIQQHVIQHVIAQGPGNAVRSASSRAGPPSAASSARPIRRPPVPKTSDGRRLTVVIQCAASKNARAGHFVDKKGRSILFVARPEKAPRNPAVACCRPDDPAGDGRTWREELLRYNRRPDENPFGLLPAWRLYRNPVYSELIEAFGEDRVFILSAGWGLLRAGFLTPNYDITFSSQAEPYKRRRRVRDGCAADGYADFRMMPARGTGPIVFLGGRDYAGLFQTLTAGAVDRRIVFYNSACAPAVPGCRCIRFKTTTRTNWHYQCARALIAGTVAIPA